MDINKWAFISGPITGIAQYESRFESAEKELYEKGFKDVINPATIAYVLPEGLPWDAYMDISLAILRHCDVIYMLKGWEQSTGARMERMYAERMGLEIIEQEDESDAD